MTANQLVLIFRQGLLAAPPPGVSEAYIEGFFRRYAVELRRVAEKALAASRRPLYATPGTRVTFSTLAEWLDGWEEIAHRKVSSAKHEAARDHLYALPEGLVDQASNLTELAALARVLESVRPPRGQRAGHPSTYLTDAVNRTRTRIVGQSERRLAIGA